MGNQSCRRDVSVEDVRDLPPSAKLVFKTLEYQGKLTQKQLVEETMLSARTVRFAINKLADAEVVTSQINIHDARQQIYTLAPEFQTDHGGTRGDQKSP